MTPTTIDLIITKKTHRLAHPTSVLALQSDHNPATATINTCTNRKAVLKTLTSYKNTKWVNFRKTLDQNIINNNIHTTQDIDNEITKLTNAFNLAKLLHTETITVKPNTLSIPPQLTNLIRQKNYIR